MNIYGADRWVFSGGSNTVLISKNGISQEEFVSGVTTVSGAHLRLLFFFMNFLSSHRMIIGIGWWWILILVEIVDRSFVKMS